MFRDENQTLKEAQDEAIRMYRESKELEPYQAEMIKMQQHIENHGKKMIVLFEGRDAAGKGSLIGTVTRYMNPKHYRIVALGKPSDKQKTQWYFQKYVEFFPSAGEVILFDRSWYNRAMVEPVFDFCTKAQYETFLTDVVGFEGSLCKQEVILIKIYLSVDKETQAKRFERRRSDPLRQWKLSEIDTQVQGLWDEFTVKKYHMLHTTEHDRAPWNIIRSNDKHKARIEAMKLILNHVNYENKNRSLDFKNDSSVVLNAEEELDQMKQERPDLFG